MRFHRKIENSSRALVSRFAVAAILLGLLSATAQCTSLSPKERGLREIAVGRALTARFAKSDGIVKNAQATSYVSLVGQAVVEAAGLADRDFHFAILNTDREVSVAGPGGYVLISKGYIKSLSSEAELAAVLAREIAHIAMNHYDDGVLTDGSLIETSESGSEELFEQINDGADPTEDGADYAIRNGLLTITSRSALDRDYQPLVYDIRDLTFPVPYFDDGPRLDLGAALNQGGQQGGGGDHQ